MLTTNENLGHYGNPHPLHIHPTPGGLGIRMLTYSYVHNLLYYIFHYLIPFRPCDANVHSYRTILSMGAVLFLYSPDF